MSRLLAVLVILCAGLLPRTALAQDVTISPLPPVIGLTPVTVTIDFGEPVTGFDLSDINTQDLEPSNLGDLGNGRFTFQLIATGTPVNTVSLLIPEGAAQTALFANTPQALSTPTRPIAARPTLTLTQVRPPTVPDGPYRADFDITTPGGSGFDGGDGPSILDSMTNATNRQINRQGDRMTIGFLPTGGPVTVSFPEGFITDRASGNGSLEQLLVDLGTYDVTPPAPILSGLASTVGLAGDEVTVDFGEEVTGFDLDDLQLVNLSAANLSDLGGGRFSFDVTATGDGPASITVPAGAAQDASGNASTETSANTSAVASRPLFTLRDVTPPATPTSLHQARFDISVPGSNGVTEGPAFLSSSLTLTNVGVRALSISGTVLTVQFQPTGGPVTVSFAESVVRDVASGNLSPAQGPFDLLIVDVTPPAPQLSGLAAVVGLAGDEITVDFGEEVTGFDLDDLQLVNLSAANLSDQGGGTFTFDVTATGDGPASIAIPAGAAQDAALNDSTETSANTSAVASRPLFTLRDVTPPATPISLHQAFFDISAPGGNGVTDGPTFFQSGAMTLTNVGIRVFELSGTVLTVQFEPTGGPVTVSFAEGLVRDVASGNLSPAQGPFDLLNADLTPPTPVLSGLGSIVGLGGTLVTVNFGETVTGFDETDLQLSNLSASYISDQGGGVFVFDVTPTGDGPASITIPAGAAQDAAGNPSTETSAETNAVASRPEVAFDRIAPMGPPNEFLVIFNVSTPTVGGPIDTRGSATATNFTLIGGAIPMGVTATSVGVGFRGTVTGGPVNFTFPAGYFTDSPSGNESLAAGPFLVGVFDLTPPAPVLSGLASTVGLAGDAVTLDFGEEVTGFDLETGLQLTNLSAANLTDQGGGTFTFDVTATGDGPASITVLAGAAQDAASNPSTATEATTAAVAARPEVTFLRVDPGVGENAYIVLFEVTAPGGSGVTGQTSLTVPNFTLQSASPGAVTADTPRIEFAYGGTATGGPVSFTFPAGFFTDGASGNPSLAQGPFEVGDFDLTPPTVTLSGTPGFPGAPYPLTITFSEPVQGFAAEAITTDGATIVNLLNGCGSVPCASFTAQVQADPGREFDHSVTVPANAAEDAAGNGNLASAPFAPPPADGSAPVLTISGVPDGFTGPVTATLTFDWGEDVFGFEQSDITVTGGTLGPITGGRQAWTAQLSVDGTQDVTVSVAANAVRDATGTPSAAASARGSIASAEVAEALIRDFLGARGTALIAAQPDLSRLLGRGGPTGSVSVTRATGDVALFTGTSGPVWAALDMQWSDIDGFSTRYSHLTFGGHATLANDALLGMMLQLDEANSAEGVAEIGGTGWLLGPYYVAAHGGLIVDARALWGRTENEISPFGTFTDRFATERFLAMLNLSGEVAAGAATLRPLLGWSYVDDRSEAYIDSLSNPVAAQRVRLTQLEAALDWTMPLGDTGTEFTGGVAGLLAREEGGNAASEGLRGRIDLGLRRQGAGPVGFDVGLWADGLGQSDFEAYGLDLRVDWRF